MDINCYKALFEQSSAMLLLMDKDFTVMAASDSYLKVTKTIRDEITGKNIFDIFPDNPNDITADGARKMRASFNRVIKNKKEDTPAILKYNIPKPQSEGGGFEVNYWRTVVSPMFDANHKLKYIIQRSEDVTENEALTAQHGEDKKALNIIEESNKRYHTILMESPFAFSIMKGKDMLITHANNLIKEIWGKGDNVEGKTLLQLLPELIGQPFPAMMDTVYTTGKPVYANEILARLNHNGKIEERYFNIVYQPHLEADETISGVITIAHEVTNEVLTRKKIEESEHRFQAAVAAVEGIVWTNNPKGEMQGEQSGWSSLTGQSHDAYQRFGWVDAIHPDDAQPTIDAWNEAVRDRKNFVFEHRVRLKNGNWGQFSVKAIPLLNEDGLIREWVGVHTDISEQKQSENLLKESEHRYQSMVHSSPSLIAIFKGEDMIIEIANDAVLESWGKGKDIIGKSIFKAMPEIAEQGFDKILLNVYKTGEPFYTYETPVTLIRNGKPQLMHYTFVYQAQRNMNGVIEGVAVLANEVTLQVEAKNKLIASEAFSSSVLNSSPDCVKILDAEGRLQFMNDNGICAMEIDDFSKFKNNYWWDLWEQKNQPLIKDAVTKALRGERVQFQSMSNTAKGTPKWWDVIVAPILIDGETEKVQRIISVSRDITDFKDAMLKVEESEKRYDNLINFSSSAIGILLGEDLVVTTANNAIIEIWGKGKEIMGKKYFEALPELAEQGYREVFAEVYKTGKPFNALETPVNILQNGKMELKYYNFLLQAQRNIYADIEGVGIIATEVTSQAIVNLKIKASEEKFRLLVLQAPVAICVLRGENYIIEVINQSMIEIWDRTMEQALNKPAFDVLPELKEQGFKELLDNVYKTGERFVAQELPIQLRRKGKLESAFVKFVYEPLREGDGTISGVMALAHEITEQVLSRKKIEESESHFRQLADLMPSKISNAGIDGKGFYFNKNWLDFLGLDFEEVKDFGYHKIMHPDELEEFQKRFLHATETGDDLEMEMRFKNKEGEFKWHLYIASPVKDENGNIKMWVSSTTEIQKIKEEEQRKGDFIKMVSHELKTPVTSIKGYVQLLLMMLEDVHEKPDPLQLKTSLVRIDRQVAKLTRLIIEMLDLTRIEESKLAMQKKLFNLNDMVTETVVDFSHGNLKHTINVYHDYVCNITGDKDRIEQVLINFIANAIKYSPNNGNIEVRVKASENNQVAVSVKDNGIGIDAKDHQKIFERFYRVSGKSEQYYPGFGIGLFIANAIIESQDGFITIDSEKGKGSVFTFTLPCS